MDAPNAALMPGGWFKDIAKRFLSHLIIRFTLWPYKSKTMAIYPITFPISLSQPLALSNPFVKVE